MQVPKMTQKTPTIFSRLGRECVPTITPTTTAVIKSNSPAKIFITLNCKQMQIENIFQKEKKKKIVRKGNWKVQILNFTHTTVIWRIEEENGQIDGLKYKASAVNGVNQSVIFRNKRQAVEHPEYTVEKGCEVWDGRKLLYCLLLPYRLKSWPTSKSNQIIQ